jgi:hypothetical protein
MPSFPLCCDVAASCLVVIVDRVVLSHSYALDADHRDTHLRLRQTTNLMIGGVFCSAAGLQLHLQHGKFYSVQKYSALI